MLNRNTMSEGYPFFDNLMDNTYIDLVKSFIKSLHTLKATSIHSIIRGVI